MGLENTAPCYQQLCIRDSLILSNKVNMGSKNGKPVIREEDIEALSKSSGLEKEAVKEAFENFVAEHPDGRMKPKAFREMMSQALPKKDASKMEKHVFRAYDTNNDGYIDFVEFMVIFYIMADGSLKRFLARSLEFLMLTVMVQSQTKR